MKILLINPPIREWAKPNILPLGLAYVASVLSQNGHQVQVMDINAFRFSRRETEDLIKRAEFDVVGIGAIVTVYKYIKWLIGLLRQYHPGKKIIVGGSVGASIPHIMLEKAGADIVCTGEGERAIVELLEKLEKNDGLEDVRGIWFRDERGKIVKNKPMPPIADLDKIPFPAWELFPMQIYLKHPVGAPNRNKWLDGSQDGAQVLSMNLSATRGCPYKCIYCYHDFIGQKYRHRSAANIVEEMSLLADRYGTGYFHFVDDEFCVDRRFVHDFCRTLKTRLPEDISWGCTGRVNLMSEDLIKEMKSAGCVLIGYGIESGSQRILDLLKKGVTVEQAKKAVRLTKKHLGWADCSFMIGSPGEDTRSLQETVDFCKELDLTPEVIFFTTPYPGTPLYKKALEEKMIIDEEEYVLGLGEQGEKVRVNFTEFSDDELLKAQESMISELKAWNKVRHPESR